MNAAAIYFATGHMFFVGMALVCLCAVPALWVKGRLPKGVLRVLTVTGVLFVVLSAAPLPLYGYGVWLGVVVALLIATRATGGSAGLKRAKQVLAGAVVISSVALCAVESWYWRTPRLYVQPGGSIYVIGDSLSAGMGAGEKSWPEVLSQTSGIKVVNLAGPGATLRTALGQADKASDDGALVIIEIGGNDMLGKTSSAAFWSQLDELLSTLRGRGHPLVMFELPLPPFCNAFGMAQRDLAQKHDVRLIPKRCLGEILAQEGSTLDGLHLSQAGHDRLAERVREMLGEDGGRHGDSPTSP